jgi:hypothetical protein
VSKNLDVAAYTVAKHITQDVTFFYESSYAINLLVLLVCVYSNSVTRLSLALNMKKQLLKPIVKASC